MEETALKTLGGDWEWQKNLFPVRWQHCGASLVDIVVNCCPLEIEEERICNEMLLVEF